MAIPKGVHSLTFYHSILWFIIFIYLGVSGYNLNTTTHLLLTLYFLCVIFIRLIFYRFYIKTSVKFQTPSTKIKASKKLLVFLAIMFIPYVLHELGKYGLNLNELFSNPSYSLVLMRQESVRVSGYGETFDIWNNLVILSNFNFLLHLFYSPRINKWVWYSAVINILYTSFLGSKMGLVVTLLMLAHGYFIRKNFKKVLSLVITATVAFSFSVFFINMNAKMDFDELVLILKSYILGGPLSFDSIVDSRVDLGNSQVLWRPFLEIARSLGFGSSIDSRHLFYVTVDGFSTNVFSWFISFFKNVPILTSFFIMFIYLFVLEFISVSRFKSNLLMFLFPSFVIGAIFSIHAEQILSGLSMYIKLTLCFIIFNYVASLSYHRREKCS